MLIQVLMSTYNGEKYLREQLDSILNQKLYEESNLEVLIRDDGSSDRTMDILASYQQDNRIKIVIGENKGAAGSFFELISMSDVKADYIAFSDQDDIWHKDKIISAIEAIANAEKTSNSMPIMYASAKRLVDENGNVIKDVVDQNLQPSFSNAVVENICTGCTVVINRCLADIARRYIPKHAIIHDHWLYLLATYYGEVVYDSDAHIDYRQHSNNEIGAGATVFDVLKAKAKYVRSNPWPRQMAMLREFADNYNGVDVAKDELVQQIVDAYTISDRIKLVMSNKYKRQRILDAIVLRWMILASNKMDK